MPNNDTINNDQVLKDAFLALPKILQEAITNADVQANLRKLADVHNLHLDKWAILENEIMMALLSITNPNDLPKNISKQLSIPMVQAQEITDAVAKIVFDPIQGELKDEVGEEHNTLEAIDALQDASHKQPIDISKFSPAPTDPANYRPSTPDKYARNTDPYHEPVE